VLAESLFLCRFYKAYSNETEESNISMGSPVGSDRSDEVFELTSEYKRTDMYSEKVNKHSDQIN
jgi:hypothetical protein